MGVANRCYDWAPEGTIQLDGRGERGNSAAIMPAIVT
jgi:hypothetical protein